METLLLQIWDAIVVVGLTKTETVSNRHEMLPILDTVEQELVRALRTAMRLQSRCNTVSKFPKLRHFEG
jgi:hypothetical protein